MSFGLRLFLVALGIIALLLVPYFAWHEPMDAYLASPEYQTWLASIKPYAWMIGLGLLAADAFLPVPAPPVMAAMGTLYGILAGGIIATVGSILAGLVGLVIGRFVGRRALRLLASETELAELQQFFDSWGAAGIVASRALPVAPEVLTVLAGTARMRLGRFMLALTIGSVATGTAIAWAGHAMGQSSAILLMMTLVPAGLWCVYLALFRRRKLQRQPDVQHRQAIGQESGRGTITKAKATAT